MNPIVNQMMQTMFGNNPLMQLYKTVVSAKNPAQMMQNVTQQNPQLQQTMNFINQNGGNAQQLYYNVCQQRNTDPNIIINQLRNIK